MPLCRLDHLTITAPTLESGAEFVRRSLGVDPQPGGEHPRMGTHNLLRRLGDSLFLEVIAPDPAAAPCLVAHIATPHGRRRRPLPSPAPLDQ